MNPDKSNKKTGKGGKKRQRQAAAGQADSTQKSVSRTSSAAAPVRPAEAAEYAFADEEVPVTDAVEPLFHRADWLVFAITAFVVMVGYYFTLAPDLTLEDSGELAVGSMYAGVPHPPGYPVWTLYTWLFTELVPFSNMAWRVALSSAVAGALSCGLIGMMVSRGVRSMFGIFDQFKEMPEDAGRAISMVTGYVAGMMMAFNGFMWSQAVIVEVYTLSVLTLVLQMIYLMRWMHGPHQYRHLWWSFFWGGIAFTNHQTLIVAMIGVLIAVLARRVSTGRDLFSWAGVFFLLLTVAMLIKGPSLPSAAMVADVARKTAVFKFLLVIGLIGVIAGMVMAVLSRKKAGDRWSTPVECWIVSLVGLLLFAAGLGQVFLKGGLTSSTNSLMFMAFLVIGTACMGVAVWTTLVTGRFFREWWQTLASYFAWGGGAAFYMYMPLAGLTNPPMQWGYPRIVEGFKHALLRGQYEKANPTSGLDRFTEQIATYVGGAVEEFNLVYLALTLIPVLAIFFRKITEKQKMALAIVTGLYGFIGLVILIKLKSATSILHVFEGLFCGYFFLILAVVPFMFYYQNRKQPVRAWIGGIGAIYLFLSLLLLFLLNPQPDRQSQQLNRVFFTASYVPVSMFIGHGLALIAAVLVTRYRQWRPWVMVLAALATFVALWRVMTQEDFYWVTRMTDFYGLALAIALFIVLAVSVTKFRLRPLLAIFILLPLLTFGKHWANIEQRGHLFGYWFGHDMFTPPFEDKAGKPLYPEMAKDAVLYGGTDPGRFCPTYMIFCESFTPPQKRRDPDFDRRDVYIITQNALADATYLMYIRAHYNRSTQLDPPFFEGCSDYVENMFLPQPAKDAKAAGNAYKSGLLASLARMSKIVSKPLDKIFNSIGYGIEKRRRVGESFFEADHFSDVGPLAVSLSKADNPLASHLKGQLSEGTVELLTAPDSERKLKKALAKDFNKLLEAGSLFDSQRFKGIEFEKNLKRFIAENPQGQTQIRLNRLLLETAYPDSITKSPGGLYPDAEMYISTPAASQKSFEAYVGDAQRRYEHDLRHPNEPKQIKPGENVQYDPATGRVSVSGQVAVMAINGLLTKDMFDRNPELDFYVEESFPLDWMYPHLTPFGIIMKIERNHVPEYTQEIVDRDHEFWSRYSDRLIGNWINYDTSVAEICQFAERVHLYRDFNEFKGDPKFVRDDNAKKAFSKLRSAIAGVYYWRINHAGGQGKIAEQQRMIREADFAFRQAFAFCPFSPEAVFRYTNLLISTRRVPDALLIAETFLKFDPNNGAVQGLRNQLNGIIAQQAAAPAPAPAAAPNAAAPVPVPAAAPQLAAMEQQFNASPTNAVLGYQLFSAYLAARNTNKALAVMNVVTANPAIDTRTLLTVLQAYTQMKMHSQRQLLIPRVVQAASKDLADPKATLAHLQIAAQAFNMCGQMPLLERTMARLGQMQKDSPETWYDLAGVQAVLRKTNDSLASLANAIRLSDARRKANPQAQDLRPLVIKDGRFNILKTLPAYSELTSK
jgi:hypothetical protein